MSSTLGLWRRGPLSDGAAVLLASGAAGGALLARPVPVAVGVAAVAAGLAWRRALPLAAAVALLCSGLAHQAWEGLAPLPAGPYHGSATLVSDPEPSFGGWRADVRTGVGRVELTARGSAGGRLSSRAAGERIEVTGRLEPLPDPMRAAPRHVRARLVADRVVPVGDGGPAWRTVNGLRGLLVRGARSLPDDQRTLFTGFVLGDDRGGSVVVADDFDGAGLSHLLVVSGQNVAFVLAVAAPLLGRLRMRARFVATIGVLVLFAAVTRFEPSVLRATAMAAVGAVAVLSGRPASGLRVLALAVTGLVVVDPLLVLSLGFRLSTAASVSIIVLAPPLAGVLRVPRWLGLPMAVTLSAQAAVAPLLVPAFGPMPVAALPANLLAEPVAGLVMMWGCTAGFVAGLLPGPLAAAVHWPTRLGLWWVASVARLAAAAPLGSVGLSMVAALALCFAVAVVAHRRQRAWPRRAALGLAGLLVVLPLVGGAPTPAAGVSDMGGAQLWRGAGPSAATVLVVPGNARPDAVLAGLRRSGVRSLDLVVLRSPGPAAAGVLAAVRQRVGVRLVWAPRGSPAPGAEAPPAEPLEAGGLRVACRNTADGLLVEVTAPGGAVPARG